MNKFKKFIASSTLIVFVFTTPVSSTGLAFAPLNVSARHSSNARPLAIVSALGPQGVKSELRFSDLLNEGNLKVSSVDLKQPANQNPRAELRLATNVAKPSKQLRTGRSELRKNVLKETLSLLNEEQRKQFMEQLKLTAMVLSAIDELMKAGRYSGAVNLALKTIEMKIEGVDHSLITKWFNELMKAGQYDGASKFLVDYLNLYANSRETSEHVAIPPKLISDVISFLKEHNLLLLLSNKSIFSRLTELDDQTFSTFITSVQRFATLFHDRNQELPEGRRLDEEKFHEQLLPAVFILEMILSDSALYAEELLKSSRHPAAVYRFLESKKKVLLDSEMTDSISNIIRRIEQARRDSGSRKKVKIDRTPFYKIIDLAQGFSEAGDKKEFIAILTAFDASREMLGQLENSLRSQFLKTLARSFGIDAPLNPSAKAYQKIYLPYLSKLAEGLRYVKEHQPDKFLRFQGLLVAMLEDKIWDYLENQNDEIGREIASHNREVRDKIKARGVDVDKWLGKSFDSKMDEASALYREPSRYEYDPIQDAQAVIDYIQRSLQMLPHESKEYLSLAQFLKTHGVQIEIAKDSQSVRLKTSGDTKKKDLIAVVTDHRFLESLLLVVQGLVRAPDVQKTASKLETVNHLRERIDTLRSRLGSSEYQAELERLRKSFRIRMIDRNPGHDLFLGDFASCCLGMSSSQFPHAMVDRLIDEGMNVIEVIDEATDKTMAVAWLYLSKDGSLVIQNLEINAEYERIKPMMDFIGETMIQYAAGLASFIHAPKLLIGMPGHGKYFGSGGFIETKYGNQKIPYGQQKIGGYLGEKYYLDSAGKSEAYFVWKQGQPLLRAELRTEANAAVAQKTLGTGHSELREISNEKQNENSALDSSELVSPEIRSELRKTIEQMKQLTLHPAPGTLQGINRLTGIDLTVSQISPATDLNALNVIAFLPAVTAELVDIVTQVTQEIAQRSELRVVIFTGTQFQAEAMKALFPNEFKNKIESGDILITSRMNEAQILRGATRAELRAVGLPEDKSFADLLSKRLPHINVTPQIASRNQILSFFGEFTEVLRSELRAKFVASISA